MRSSLVPRLPSFFGAYAKKAWPSNEMGGLETRLDEATVGRDKRCGDKELQVPACRTFYAHRTEPHVIQFLDIVAIIILFSYTHCTIPSAWCPSAREVSSTCTQTD